MLNLAVLISGRGSNLQALQKNIESGILQGKAQIAVVLANKATAAGLTFAREHGLQTMVCPAEKDVLAGLAKQQIDLICLAGYMRLLSADFVNQYKGKLINIHPTLLPKYPGLHVHEKVLAAGEKESGCTVHYVDTGADTGQIIAQRKVPVLPDDTPETLAARVLEQEHVLYSQVILQIANAVSVL
ncbi:phosphoribosylglycinamide formyltransferase [Candidatus Termititenax persephonae]|uniref:Phosphoribosylglycinamide formyltransferase n=1 Tax=Candidatus Termititenax persephonae TaxID=2218525 RepID=A0A388THT3_9BACT|nr:phosphoribosylglycinamide formyltransferase [Candidatus Termititenax persephonae]